MTERTEITRSRIATAAPFRTRAIGLILGAGVTGGLLVGLTGCGSVSEAKADGSGGAAPARVSTAQVALRAIPESAIVAGTVIADRFSEVAADAPGKVIAVYVERG